MREFLKNLKDINM